MRLKRVGARAGCSHDAHASNTGWIEEAGTAPGPGLPDSPAPKRILLMENAVGYSFRDGTLYVDTFFDGATLRLVRIE